MRYLVLFFSLFSIITQAQEQTLGLQYNDSLAYNGYTLVSPSSGKTVYLVDNCGKTINVWETDNNTKLSAYLDNEGNLIRPIATSNGGGVEIRNWDNELVWQMNNPDPSNYTFHHDIEPLPNGNILVLAWEIIPIEIFEEAGGIILSNQETIRTETILEFKPIGTNNYELVWQWRTMDHLVQNIYPEMDNFGEPAENPHKIHINYEGGNPNNDDWMHANFIDYNAALDQIIMSVRYFNEFWIIDHSTTIEESAGSTGGNYGKGGDLLYRWGNPAAYNSGTEDNQQLFWQHHTHWIPEGYSGAGNILVFNNGNYKSPIEFSTVVEVELPYTSNGNYEQPTSGEAFLPETPTWQYNANNENNWFVPKMSAARRLPNGNTLISDASTGEAFEVDVEGILRWKYKNPQGQFTAFQGDEGNFGIFMTQKYEPNFIGFENKDLTPGLPLELEAIDYECTIYEAIEEPQTNNNYLQKEENIFLYPNPINNGVLHIDTALENNNNIEIRVNDILGRDILRTEINGQTVIDVSWLNSGIYTYRIFQSSKLIKTGQLIVSE